MKYLITEEQFKTAEQSIRAYRLEQTILKFFDDNLTPYDGWDSPQGYERELEENGGELFLQIKNDGEWNLDTDNHMWYSLCDNENLSEPLPEGHCPVVTLPQSTYDALNGYFGDKVWITLFRRWFISHTGLLVVQVDSD